jgi:hypothetical protein
MRPCHGWHARAFPSPSARRIRTSGGSTGARSRSGGLRARRAPPRRTCARAPGTAIRLGTRPVGVRGGDDRIAGPADCLALDWSRQIKTTSGARGGTSPIGPRPATEPAGCGSGGVLAARRCRGGRPHPRCGFPVEQRADAAKSAIQAEEASQRSRQLTPGRELAPGCHRAPRLPSGEARSNRVQPARWSAPAAACRVSDGYRPPASRWSSTTFESHGATKVAPMT